MSEPITFPTVQKASNVIPFRRVERKGQGILPLGGPSGRRRAADASSLDERRVAHRRRMLEFLRVQTLSRTGSLT
jgi:hypothetical protein